MSVLKIRNEKSEVVEMLALKGDPGYTPQKGVDYYTDADREALIEDTINAIRQQIEAIKAIYINNVDENKRYVYQLQIENGKPVLFYEEVTEE